MPIDALSKDQCCGCNACGDVCPTKAISFVTDEEGFWYPQIDDTKCTNCELCTKTCPVINVQALKHNDFDQPKCYAAENKNLEVVFDSTSGGLFSAFADRMYRDKGFVGGAVFNDDYRSVKQFISNDKKDLPRLRSSKYLQSDLTGFYTQVRDLLNAGEKVLVCGCPCQMAGLRSFLRKPYDNLIVLDFICLGINSPLIWQRYLDSYEERYGSPVVYAKSKSKEYGWRNLTSKVKLANGQSIYETRDNNLYTQGYIITHAFIRPSCYDCKFRGFPRMADVTIADFWGIEKYNTSMEKNLGTSLVMVNSKKGQEWFDRIRDRLNYIEMPFETTLGGNRALTQSPSRPNINRAEFFRDVKVLSFSEVAKKYGFSFDKPQPKLSLKQNIKRKIRTLLHLGMEIVKNSRHLNSSLRTLKHNKIKDILANKFISFAPNAYGEISPNAKLAIDGRLRIGHSRYKKFHGQTKILIDDHATLRVVNDFTVGDGSDIQIFPGGELILKGKGGSNVNLTIICADKIEIGEDVMIGRGVTIRDNNGGHYINRAGYKNTSPVIIGDKAWLCEGCTIMPGVKIGAGAIVGAHAFVTSNIPANAMVSGNPAVIVDEDVLWKY